MKRAAASTTAGTKRLIARLSKRRLTEMIEEATVDCYNDSEQVGGWFTMVQDNLAVPFPTIVLGVPVTVERVDLDRNDQIVEDAFQEGQFAVDGGRSHLLHPPRRVRSVSPGMICPIARPPRAAFQYRPVARTPCSSAAPWSARGTRRSSH